MLDLNYFVCTLGQAAELHREDDSRRIEQRSILGFIQHQARRLSDRPAVGFANPGPSQSQASTVLYTYHDLCQISSYIATKCFGSRLNHEAQTVGLLCRSTPEFLFSWLALMQAGHAVLLIAPQNAAPAIAHLCDARHVSQLFFDEAYAALAKEASTAMKKQKQQDLDLVPIAFDTQDAAFKEAASQHPPASLAEDVRPEDTAFYFHTSGTSSGLPKPIPQSHRGAVLALAKLPESAKQSTYSTTPLYHGGVADCFRAWSSDALIWLFWNTDSPITAPNVCKCLGAIAARTHAAPVRYFTSVPYILQMMSSGDEGLRYLQNMDLVGVGGAALPAEVGDALVNKGVNLVSRYGSAECGFLLSSHRKYEHDKGWQYLRSETGAESLAFEPKDDALSELVVLPTWPHRAKTNRDDGSFATSDLLAPHPSIPNAWKYHSRSDAQLTLVTGKKFDPSPLENSIATSPLLDDVYIFGDDRPFPGALLFRSEQAKDMSDHDLLAALSSSIESLNIQSANHARLARNMLKPMSHDSNRLQKSSKGTLLRNKAADAYKDVIDATYNGVEPDLGHPIPDEQILGFLRERVQSILSAPRKPDADMDLFGFGVDSVASIQLRHLVKRLIAQLPSASGRSAEPSLTLVEECGTAARLAQYIRDVRGGHTPLARSEQDELDLMLKLVDKYSTFTTPIELPASSPDAAPATDYTVLLTGSTGSLGTHLLHLLRHHPRVSHIHLLVRGASPDAAHARVDKALTSRHLPGLSSPSSASLSIHQARLSDPLLGLAPAAYRTLAASITHIFHAAWTVNFRLRLPSFSDHLAALQHLLSLAHSTPHPPSFLFASSTASVAAFPPPIRESPSSHPAAATPLGYARSKWVAERICARATSPRVAILRIGQLAGDTAHGAWNASEAWPILLAASRRASAVPRLRGVALDWLPVDVAARGTLELLFAAPAGREVEVYHVLNDAAPATAWAQMVEWVGEMTAGAVGAVEADVWFKMAEGQAEAGKLVGMWREAFGGDGGKAAGGFSTARARAESRVLREEVRPVDRAYFGKLWAWIEGNV